MTARLKDSHFQKRDMMMIMMMLGSLGSIYILWSLSCIRAVGCKLHHYFSFAAAATGVPFFSGYVVFILVVAPVRVVNLWSHSKTNDDDSSGAQDWVLLFFWVIFSRPLYLFSSVTYINNCSFHD
jgi:hypothetical protein